MILMEVVETYKHTIGYKGESYDIFLIVQHDTYELYIAPSSGDYPMEYMFGLPAGENTKEEAMGSAIANVQDYLPTFILERWI